MIEPPAHPNLAPGQTNTDQKTSEVKRLLLIACSATKQPDPELLPALDRYQGTWFKVLHGYRRAHPEQAQATLHLAGSANEIFHLPGSWGISYSDAEPERWQPVTTTCVFVFNEMSSWDVYQVDFLVGTSDPLAFYQDDAWAGFDPENDDYEYHQIQEAYTESCAAHIRTLIGDAIPFSFTLADIQDKMLDKRSRILSVHYHYPPRKKASASPIAITARNRAGQRKRLKLVS